MENVGGGQRMKNLKRSMNKPCNKPNTKIKILLKRKFHNTVMKEIQEDKR